MGPFHQFAPKRSKTRIVRIRDIETGAEFLKLGSVKVRIFDKDEDSHRFVSFPLSGNSNKSSEAISFRKEWQTGSDKTKKILSEA